MSNKYGSPTCHEFRFSQHWHRYQILIRDSGLKQSVCLISTTTDTEFYVVPNTPTFVIDLVSPSAVACYFSDFFVKMNKNESALSCVDEVLYLSIQINLMKIDGASIPSRFMAWCIHGNIKHVHLKQEEITNTSERAFTYFEFLKNRSMGGGRL